MPFSSRAKITRVSAAARAHRVRSDGARETKHQIGPCAPRGRRRGVRESQDRERAPEPRTTDTMDPPSSVVASNFVGENRYLMTRGPHTLGGDDQIALGAATGGVEAPRQQSYAHRSAPLRDFASC